MGRNDLRIVLVISSLGPGGAERVLSTLANHWASIGHSVVLLTLDDGTVPPFFPLSTLVTHRALGVARKSPGIGSAILNNLRRIRSLRQAIKDQAPDVVLSFVEKTNILVLLATMGRRFPVVVSERVDPAHYEVGAAWRALRSLTYPFASALVAQSQKAISYFSSAVACKSYVILNPIIRPTPAEVEVGKLTGGRRVLITLGRLAPQKNHQLLIRVFAQLAAQRPEWVLEIWGEGPERPDLERTIAELGLGERVFLPGLADHPEQTLRQADLFVLSSRFEGFPNALCEAMACGLPVVSFDCDTGPREIIRDGIDGVLVPPGDEAAMAKVLGELMDDQSARAALAAKAPEIIQKLEINVIRDQWIELFRSLVDRRRK